ncbi:putative membrane protein [Plasmodium gaboni]|uniref:Putative membrane protein n=1 Tax=Plasmodium gaboni TaxID=647221 RepID=A0A151LNV1_9APIC|nr:putative membrane protein [Plasmodium gaboni]KYO00797.1 putative membrane protein [Plasmodium gaboni]
MNLFNFLIFLLLLFFINLFFVKSNFKNDESYNIPLNTLFNKGKNIRKRVCNECFYKNEVSLIFNSCKVLENMKNNNLNKAKIMSFIRQSPKMIKNYVTLKYKSRLSEILSAKYLKKFISSKKMLIFDVLFLLWKTYFKYNVVLSILALFKTIFIRFLAVYIIQLLSSFLLFHYINMFSQRTQAYILFISGSNYSSRIIGFFQLNIINYYVNIFSEAVQIAIIRILFNQYEAEKIKSILYNSTDYFINTTLTNKYSIMYQCTKRFVISRFNKLSLFTFNYLRYFVLTNLFFKLFNGTYNKYSPSDVKMPGVYSDKRKSLNKDMKYATKREINILKNFCKDTGCHTCGMTCHEKFIGDHQPPVQIIKDMVNYYKKRKFILYFLKLFKLYDTKQRLYPQCVRCSQLQSASVRCKKLRLIPHYNTIRMFHYSSIFHLFLKMLLLTNWKQIIFWDKNSIN